MNMDEDIDSLIKLKQRQYDFEPFKKICYGFQEETL